MSTPLWLLWRSPANAYLNAYFFGPGNVSLGLLARAVSAGGRSQLRSATAGAPAKKGSRKPSREPSGIVASFKAQLQLAKHVFKARPAQRARTNSTSPSEVRPPISTCSSGQL